MPENVGALQKDFDRHCSLALSFCNAARPLIVEVDKETSQEPRAAIIDRADTPRDRGVAFRRATAARRRADRAVFRLQAGSRILTQAKSSRLAAVQLQPEFEESLEKEIDDDARAAIKKSAARYSNRDQLEQAVNKGIASSITSNLGTLEQSLWGKLARAREQTIRQIVSAHLALALTGRLESRLEYGVSDLAGALASASDRLAGLEKSLRHDMASGHTNLAALADELAAAAEEVWATFSPYARALDLWALDPGGKRRIIPQQVRLSLQTAATLRQAMRAVAMGTFVALLFADGASDPASELWVKSASGDSFSTVEEVEYVAPQFGDAFRASQVPGQQLNVTGAVIWSKAFQMNRDKRVTVLQVAVPQAEPVLLVSPYFTPSYVGIETGTVVQLRGTFSDAVLDEFTNANTRTTVETIRTSAGTEAGIVIDRFQLAGAGGDDWGNWTATQLRPMYDIAPNSLHGLWSLHPGLRSVIKAASWYTESADRQRIEF